jgi:hypothetical protein
VGIGLETFDEILDPVEEICEYAVASTNTLNRLRDLGVTITNEKVSGKTLTESRTPMPVKIILAGGYACNLDIKVLVTSNLQEFTCATPAPMVAENV